MAQQGFVYEENVAKFLKPIGLVPKNFIPAGAGHGQPDLMLKYGKQESGCELKITDASAGSLVLKYNPKTKKWGFGDVGPDDKEKLFIKDLADYVKLFDVIAKSWAGLAPWKFNEHFKSLKDPRAAYNRDHKMFSEIKGNIPAQKIEQYYNRKDTYYVNIGTHGFYLFGDKNPLKLVGVPRFAKSAEAVWRARVQAKGGGAYQFTFEMGFSVKIKSPYNIGPLGKNAGVVIRKKDANLTCFPKI